MLENNRAAPRHRVLKSGSIDFNGGVIDCVVRNISETGAALEVASPLGIPETFNLVISGDHSSRPCRLPGAKTNGSALHSSEAAASAPLDRLARAGKLLALHRRQTRGH